jgi:hypothetical protein
LSRILRVAVLVAAAAACTLALAASASAAPSWAPAASATIHPGVQVFTNGAQCTSNFVYYDASNVYLGQAAHCSSQGGQTATDGCTTQSLPIGTPVDITGASKPGTLVYNSWITMQQQGETDADTCAYNDLALIKVDPADVAKVNPSIPFWGGPTGTGGAAGTAAKVLSYGNSELRAGITALSPKEGYEVSEAGNGWSHQVATVTPGVPGDSGSAFMDKQGRALGVLSTLELAPVPASNGVGDITKELQYLAGHTAFAVTLANGTERFRGPLLPA